MNKVPVFYICVRLYPIRLYRSGSASHMILVRDPAERTPQDTNIASQGKGFSPYRTWLYTVQYTFSLLFDLNVFNVGRVSTEVTFWHSAEYGSDPVQFRRNSAEFRGISRNFAGIAHKSLQKSKNSAEFRVGGIPWTPKCWSSFRGLIARRDGWLS